MHNIHALDPTHHVIIATAQQPYSCGQYQLTQFAWRHHATNFDHAILGITCRFLWAFKVRHTQLVRMHAIWFPKWQTMGGTVVNMWHQYKGSVGNKCALDFKARTVHTSHNTHKCMMQQKPANQMTGHLFTFCIWIYNWQTFQTFWLRAFEFVIQTSVHQGWRFNTLTFKIKLAWQKCVTAQQTE